MRLAVALTALALPCSALATHGTVRWAVPDTNGAFAALHSGISADGSRVIFETNESITLDDLDGGQSSLYQWTELGLTLLTNTGAGSAAFFSDMSDDGRRVLIQTDAALTGDDTDTGQVDAYLIVDGVPQLVSTGTTTEVAFPHALSADGTRAFFSTGQDLSGEGDTTAGTDIYRWENGTIEQMSDVGSGFATGVSYQGSMSDGSKVWFHTTEGLDGLDNDGAQDAYQGEVGAITLMSEVGGGTAAFFTGASGNGARVFFRTTESLDVGDGDANQDVYAFTGGAPLLVTPGTAAADSTWLGASEDGSKVWFHTLQSLDADDTDAEFDIYERSGAVTTLVSDNASASLAGSAGWGGATPDGSQVWFTALDDLEAGDTDGLNDAYEWNGATQTLVSTATPTTGANFVGASTDGTRIFFSTTEPIAAGDGFDDDIYERYRGAIWLATPGTTVAGASLNAEGITPNGRFLAVNSTDPLDPADTDGEDDVYRVSIPAAGAVTGDPGTVSETAATLTGTVTSQNELTSYVFEFGPTAAYGNQTGVSPVSFGPGSEPVSNGISGLDPGTTYHYRLVAANIGGTGAGEDRTFTTAAPAQAPPGTQPPPGTTPVPDPVLGRTFNAEPVSGRVLARIPGTTRFVPIERLTSLPTGTIVDTRRGRVRLFAADGRGRIQSAEFYEGMFRLVQPARGRGLVELHLFGGKFKGCGRAARPAGAAANRKTRSVRHLWGDGRGKFRTVGRFSSATLRGTQWLTDDRCDGTLTRVTKGAVNVRDFVRRKTILVRAGKRYLARRR